MLLSILFSGSVKAQTFKVAGRLQDKLAPPVTYATVALSRAGDSL